MPVLLVRVAAPRSWEQLISVVTTRLHDYTLGVDPSDWAARGQR